jgi:hypothetical protein
MAVDPGGKAMEKRRSDRKRIYAGILLSCVLLLLIRANVDGADLNHGIERFPDQIQSRPTDEARPDASSLLARLVKQRASLPPYVLQVETQTSWRAGKEEGAEVHVDQVRWDGTRVDVIGSRCLVDGEARVFAGSTRGLWDGRQFLFRQKLQSRSGEETSLEAGFSSDKARAVRLISSFYGGGFLAGYLDPEVHICERLKKASNMSLRSATEDVKGNPCYVLTANVEGTRYTLWIDPEKGFNLRRAVVEGADPAAGPVTRRLEDIEILKVDGFWIPVSGVYITTFKTGGQKFASRRTGITLNPDFEKMKAFQMDEIPNGTPMVNLDNPGRRYLWKDGQVVTGVSHG